MHYDNIPSILTNCFKLTAKNAIFFGVNNVDFYDNALVSASFAPKYCPTALGAVTFDSNINVLEEPLC